MKVNTLFWLMNPGSNCSKSAKENAQYGYTVAFHDHETFSSTIPSGFFMSPGSVYKVDLSMVKVRSLGGSSCADTLISIKRNIKEEIVR